MDTVSLAGLKYTNQTFGVANVESHDFDGLPISGIMGTAFGSISTSGSPTVFENLMASGQVLAPFFSVHMARASRTGSEVWTFQKDFHDYRSLELTIIYLV